MKKLMTAVSLAIAVGGFATVTQAETWFSPATVALSTAAADPLILFKGVELECDMTGSATLDGSNATVTTIGLSGDSLCALVAFTNFPYNMEGNADGTVTLENVDVQGVTGNCLGDLTGNFDQTTGEITFIGAEILSNPAGGAPCIVDGVVGTNPQAGYVN